MNSLLLTGISGPAGIFGPGGLADLTGGGKSAPAAQLAAPVAVTPAGTGLSKTTLLAAGAGLVVLLMAMRR